MNDASERYAQQIEAARLAVGRGDRSAAVAALSEAIEATRREPALHREHAAALVRLGALQQELGRPVEAECLLTEAIFVGEQRLGAHDPSLGVALNELSRLHIRQADFGRAEAVLKRLLLLARAKGDRHPDVATALAGLGVAKRGLGENAAAEVLFRHALKLREEVLAPDHMAIVVTLEQLSDTCATRGNLAEALVLLHRALLKRERALGVEHATSRALRARMADLERRVLRGSMPPARVTADRRTTPGRPRSAASTPPTPPNRATELVFLYQPEPPAPRPVRPARERVPTPARAVAATAALSDTAAPALHTPSVALERAAPPAQAAALALLPASGISPVRATADAPIIETSSRDLADLWSSMKRATRYASAGAAVVALAIAGSEIGTTGGNDSENAPSASAVESRSAVVAPASGVTPQPANAAPAAATSPDAPHAAPSAAAPEPARATEAPAAPPKAPSAVPSLRRLVLPKVSMPSLDSLLRNTSKVVRDVDAEPIAARGSMLASDRGEDAAVTRPVLIYAPTPRYPDELRAHPIDGEVVVQFRVNDKGRVDASSMQVLQSGHELFSAAVRSVLPKFRFEPARATAPGSKPQSALVQFRTQFNARN